MKKNEPVSFEGLTVQKVFSGGNGPPAVITSCPSGYEEMFANEKYGPRMKCKMWRSDDNLPEEGQVIDIKGHWDEYKGQFSVSIDGQRDDEWWRPSGGEAESFDQRPIAAVPTASGKPSNKPSEDEYAAMKMVDFKAYLGSVNDAAAEQGYDTDIEAVQSALIKVAGAFASGHAIERSRNGFAPRRPTAGGVPISKSPEEWPNEDDDVPF